MTASQRPRRPAMLAAVTIVVAFGAGCTADSSDADTEPPRPGGTPSPIVDEVGAEPAFPAEAQEYAESTVGAWAAPDLARLAELATPEVLAELIELPGPPDPRWTFIECAAAEAASACAFFNTNGDHLVVRVAHASLGGPRAATEISFEPTTYPTDARAYLAEFVTAWQEGNLARMNTLARPVVVEAFRKLTPTDDPEYGDLTGDSVITIRLAETEVTTHLDPAQLGGPGAITRAEVPPAT